MTDEEFKQTLWGVATELRRLVLVEKYKHPVFGLVFPAYVSDMFDVQAKAIRQRIDRPPERKAQRTPSPTRPFTARTTRPGALSGVRRFPGNGCEVEVTA